MAVIRRVGAIVWIATCPVPALASGGAHVIDDAVVETIGTCHLENWVSRTGERGALANSAPACTFTWLPTVEIGAAVQRDWADGVPPTTLAGPSVKWLIAAPERGPSFALLGTAAFDVGRGGVRTVAIVAPVTFTLGDRARLHLNAGWTRTGRVDSAFYGAQVEYALAATLGAMGEAFRLTGATGVQAGLRWTPKPGWFDVDLLAARESDAPVRITLGLTLRR